MKRLKASYTIEASYVIAITMLALAGIIITAYKERSRIVMGFIAHTANEQLAYTDKNYAKEEYNKDKIIEEAAKYKDNISNLSNSAFDINLHNDTARTILENSKERVEVSQESYNPENFMRMSTLMENIYESVTNSVQEKP